MMTNYATKKQMIDSINQRIRQELRKAGLNIPDPNYDLKSNALKSGGNAASDAIDLDDDDKKDGSQVKEEKPQFIFPGEENFVSKDIDFTWILDTQSHETIEMVLKDDYFDYKDIKDFVLVLLFNSWAIILNTKNVVLFILIYINIYFCFRFVIIFYSITDKIG